MNMPHPFHPDSPEYDAMLAAGRVGTRIKRERHNGCPFDGEPIAGDMRRTDYLRAARFRHCRNHLFWIEQSGQPVAVRWWCSVCEKPVKAGYELDGSGRCSECQP